MRAKTAVRTMDMPFRVTERMTLSSVSSRYTTSNKRTEKKKGAESEETKNQVNDMVDNGVSGIRQIIHKVAFRNMICDLT